VCPHAIVTTFISPVSRSETRAITGLAHEQAKGMIAQRHGVDMETAFTALRDHARTHNLRLADLARDVTKGHHLATPDHP